jgi:hypothetical protein
MEFRPTRLPTNRRKLNGDPAPPEETWSYSVSWRFDIDFDQTYDLKKLEESKILMGLWSLTTKYGAYSRKEGRVEVSGSNPHRHNRELYDVCPFSWTMSPDEMRRTIEECGGALTPEFEDEDYVPDWHTFVECFVEPGTEIWISEKHTTTREGPGHLPPSERYESFEERHSIHWVAGEKEVSWDSDWVSNFETVSSGGEDTVPILPVWFNPKRTWPEELKADERYLIVASDKPGREHGALYGSAFE